MTVLMICHDHFMLHLYSFNRSWKCFLSVLRNKWFNLSRYALYCSHFLSWSLPLNLLIYNLFFVFIDSFKAGVSQGLLLKFRLLIFRMGKHLLYFSDIIMKRWICYLGITHSQYLPPINSWHCIPEPDNISMAHVTPKRRFRITQGAFAYIACNMEHSKMIWYTGTWYSLYMLWVSFKIVSKYMIYTCSSVFSYSGGLGYQRKHTVWVHDM